MYNAHKIEQQFYNMYRAGHWPVMPEGYGVSIDKQEGLYKIIGVHHLNGQENGGNHNCYISVLDDHGNRIKGIHAAHGYYDKRFDLYLDKPEGEPHGNFPMWSNVDNYWVQIGNNGDIVRGLTTQHPDEGIGNTYGHHSFHCVFIRSTHQPPEPPEAKPPEAKPISVTDIRVLVAGVRYKLIAE